MKTPLHNCSGNPSNRENALKAGAVGVIGYGGVDIKGQSQSRSPLSAGNARSGPRSERIQEIFELKAEWLGFFYRKFLKVEAGGWVERLHGLGGCASGYVDGEEFLAGEVQ